MKDKSLIIVHTGKGKGKSSAAFGMALRMVAHGKSAAIVQFMKGTGRFTYGEVLLAKKLDGLDVFTMGAGFTWETKDRQKDIDSAEQAWEKAVQVMESGKYNLVVLDEIVYTMDYGFLSEEKVIDYIKKKPVGLHVVLTGRNASSQLMEAADLVTEMKNIKHPFKEKGIPAQKGIDW
ncbi:MAG: cob(I)yrinic acid a,c-diamide adenosyltransferase [Leptospirales bacterium]